MSFIEFLGFLITMGAMMLLFGRRVKEEQRRRQNPDESEEGEGLLPTDPLREYIRTVEGSDEEEEEAPPKRKLRIGLESDFKFQPDLDKHHLAPKMADYKESTKIESLDFTTSLDSRYIDHAYKIVDREKHSYGSKVIGRLHSRRDMIICHEIFSRPKSER